MTAPRLQNSAATAGAEEDAGAGTTMLGDNGGRRGVEERREAAAVLGPSREWGLQKVSGRAAGGRWARPPPLAGPRRPRRPLPPGPARRPGRGRVAPGRG